MTISPSIFFVLLGACTASVVVLALIIWWRTRSVAFFLGFAALYYWSLHGAWLLVRDVAHATSGMRYEYLFTKLFPIELNLDYAWALVLYTTFIVVVQGTILFSLPARSRMEPTPATRLRISHVVLLLLASSAGVASYLIIRPNIANAVALNLSIYSTISAEAIASSIPWYTTHQLLLEVALLSAAIGAAVHTSGHGARYIRGGRSKWTAIAYMILLPILTGFSFVIGRKHEPFFALLAGTIFYLYNAQKPRRLRLAAVGLLGVLGLGMVDLVRSAPLAAIQSESREAGIGAALNRLLSSNEAYGAHFSLYGALRYDVPLTYGSSFLSLMAAIVPRALGASRPDDIYAHYARGVRAIEDQQYSIHHATGWYLNFGVFGVVLGAAVLGGLWVWLYTGFITASPWRSAFARPFAALAFCTFSAGMPRIIRAGPEAYKGVVLELLLLPAAIVGLASVRIDVGLAQPIEPESV